MNKYKTFFILEVSICHPCAFQDQNLVGLKAEEFLKTEEAIGQCERTTPPAFDVHAAL